MKNHYISRLLLLTLTVFSLVMTGCKKDSSNPATSNAPVDPANANALTDVLQITNATKMNGSLPTPTASGTGLPTSTQLVSAYEAAAGAQMELYLDYNAPQGLGGVYVGVDGASKYFKITNPVSASVQVMAGTTSGQIVIPIVIPSNVNSGSFAFSYCIYDANGRVSNVIHTTVQIGQASACSTQSAAGGEGITIRNFNMGSASGAYSITYNTLTEPDRVDVYQSGAWKAGTGTNPSGYPPLLSCQEIYTHSPMGSQTVYEGYIGTQGDRTLNMNYNPAQGQVVTVRVSGCTGGTTYWSYSITCPH